MVQGVDDFAAFAGDDVIFGNNGNDRLDGGAGADKIYGGRGADYLIGRTGNDQFVFNTAVVAAERDLILDFTAGDKIVLENAVFKGLATAASLAPGAFQLGTKALQADDRIIYNRSNGEVYFDQDGTGALHRPILVADLLNKAALTSASFMVI